jgi:signal transduction histidine kinase
MALGASALISFGALVCYSVLLLIVLRRGFASRVHRYFALYLLSMIIWSFAAFAIFAEVGFKDTLFWNRFLVFGSAAMPVAFFGFVQEFVGKPQPRWMYLGVFLFVAIQIANMMGLVILNAHVVDGLLYNEYGPALIIPSATWVLFMGYSALILIREYRATKDVGYRNKLKYPLIVVVLIAMASVTNATPLRIYPTDVAVNVICALLIAYAIFRHQLLDVSVVVRKGLLYSVPTVVIGAAYFLLIYFATRLFHAFGGPQIFVLSLAVAIMTAMIAQPLHQKAQAWVDKLFFRDKYDSSLMLQRLSRTATVVLDLDSLTNRILDDVNSTMHIKGAAFFLKQVQTGDFVLTSQKGLGLQGDMRLESDHLVVDWQSRHDNILTGNDVDALPQFKALWGQEKDDLERIGAELFIPLKTQGELVGIFAVGPKLSGETYSHDDQLILTTLANQTATAIEKARLYEAAQQELAQRNRAEKEIRRRAAQLESLNATISAVAAASDLQALLETALDHALRALGLEMGAIWLCRDWWREGLKHGAASPQEAAFSSSLLVLRGLSPDSDPVLEHLARTVAPEDPKPVAQADLENTEVAALAACLNIRASLTVPILVEGQHIGTVSLLATAPRLWSVEDITLSEAVGRQLGTAAERLRLFQEVQRHADGLATALDQARQLDRLKSEFIQSVSHELRTPLALARGYAELLGEGELGELAPGQKNAVDVIVRRVRMLSELVEDITLILGAEARPLAREPVALDNLARAAVEEFRVSADGAGITLQSEIAPNVAPALGESVYLRRVLDNLIGNALKFTPAGNTIIVRVCQEDDRIVLQVSDTGIGIPPEQQDKIFQRFFQVDGSTRRRYGGVGLGLALVKEVVETLGGDVGVESQVDRGSTFTVRLPVAEET